MQFDEYKPKGGWIKHRKRTKRIEGVINAFFLFCFYATASTLIFYVEVI